MADWKEVGEVIRDNNGVSVFAKASAALALEKDNPINASLCSEDILHRVITDDSSRTQRQVLEAITTREDLEDYRKGSERAIARVACINGCMGVVVLEDGTRMSHCKLLTRQRD